MGRRRVLLAGDPVADLADYLASGGGEGLRAATALGTDGVLDELEISGLRGRGGAGFPAALKWRSIVAGGSAAGVRFTVANGAEGEPGTFKDRFLLRHNPFLMLEGLLIAAVTVGAERAFVALKRSFTTEAEQVARAAAQIADAGWAPDVSIEIVGGPSEYLFGEEKALLEVIEGEEPLPRLFPPYIYGLFTTSPQMGWSAGRSLGDADAAGSNPTLVNNVETLSAVPLILTRGGEWYRSMGTPESTGTVVCTVSGDTVRHGVDEFELGTPLEEIIEEVGGGVAAGRRVGYVLSGVSNPVVPGDRLATPASYEAMEAAGTGLGSAGFIVHDDRTDPAELAAAVARFLWVESCGQCPACKLGLGETTALLEGSRGDGVLDLSTLGARLATVDDAARCYLPTQARRLVGSLVPDIRTAGAAPRRGIEIAALVDLVGDRFSVDERQRHKRPDWTMPTP